MMSRLCRLFTIVVLLGVGRTVDVEHTVGCPPGSLCLEQQHQMPRKLLQTKLQPTGQAPSARHLQQEGDADGAVESGSSKWQLDSSHQHDSFHRRLERMRNGWTEWPAHSQAEDQAVRSPVAPQARSGSAAPAPAAAHGTAPVPA